MVISSFQCGVLWAIYPHLSRLLHQYGAMTLSEPMLAVYSHWGVTLADMGKICRYQITTNRNKAVNSVLGHCAQSHAKHYSDVVMGTVVSQITSLTIVYSTVYSGVDQRKHQSSALLAFMRGIHRSQRASNADNVSIWWRHQDTCGGK